MLRRLAPSLTLLACAALAASCSPSSPTADTPASPAQAPALPALAPDPALSQAIARAHQACADTPDHAPHLGLTCTTPTARAIIARLRQLSDPATLDTFAATFPPQDPARLRHAHALRLALTHKLTASPPPSPAAAQRLLDLLADAPAPLALVLAPLAVEAATLTGLDDAALRILSAFPHPEAQAEGYRHLAIHTTRHLGTLRALTKTGDPRLRVAAIDAVRLTRQAPPDDACAWATDAAKDPNVRVAQAAGRAALRCGPAHTARLLDHILALHHERKLNQRLVRTLRNVCTPPTPPPDATLCAQTLDLLKLLADDVRAPVRLRGEALWLRARQHPEPDAALRDWVQLFQGHPAESIRNRAAQALAHLDRALAPPSTEPPDTAPTPPSAPDDAPAPHP